MASFTAEVVVHSSITQAIEKLKPAVKDKLYGFATDVMAESVQVTPWDTGTLAGSGHVGKHMGEGGGVSEGFVYQDGDQLCIDMGFGGPAAGYALAVHENLSPNVHWSKAGTGPKYLENPFKERRDKLEPAIVEGVNFAFK